MRILVVTSRWPWPPRRGDQVRATQCLAALAAAHAVTLLAPAPPAGEGAGDPAGGLRIETYAARPQALRAPALLAAALAGHPLQSALFGSTDLRRRLRQLAGEAEVVILQLARLADVVRELPDRPLVVDFIDSLALNLRRRAMVDRVLWRPALRFEAARLARCETALVARAALGLVVSERDRRAILAAAPAAAGDRVRVVPLAVAAVANGLANAQTPPTSPDAALPARGGARLVLTGNLGYFPNADAARWFLDQVWPALRQARPTLELTLAGDRPSAGLARAARRAGVRLLAAPPSLAAILAESTLALAPLRCGSGVPIKVLEAWAAGVPVVASPWAAAGTTAVVGRDLAVAESPAEWRAEILRLLDSPPARAALVAAGRARLAADHAPAVVAAAWRSAIERAASRPKG